MSNENKYTIQTKKMRKKKKMMMKKTTILGSLGWLGSRFPYNSTGTLFMTEMFWDFDEKKIISL